MFRYLKDYTNGKCQPLFICGDYNNVSFYLTISAIKTIIYRLLKKYVKNNFKVRITVILFTLSNTTSNG